LIEGKLAPVASGPRFEGGFDARFFNWLGAGSRQVLGRGVGGTCYIARAGVLAKVLHTTETDDGSASRRGQGKEEDELYDPWHMFDLPPMRRFRRSSAGGQPTS
jgi:hypothetical protein